MIIFRLPSPEFICTKLFADLWPAHHRDPLNSCWIVVYVTDTPNHQLYAEKVCANFTQISQILIENDILFI